MYWLNNSIIIITLPDKHTHIFFSVGLYENKQTNIVICVDNGNI